MSKKGEIIICLICFLALFPFETVQQRWNSYSSSRSAYKDDIPNEKASLTKNTEIHWKSVGIIILGVLILGAICYGTNCLFICQMVLCNKATEKYTKMDLTSQV